MSQRKAFLIDWTKSTLFLMFVLGVASLWSQTEREGSLAVALKKWDILTWWGALSWVLASMVVGLGGVWAFRWIARLEKRRVQRKKVGK